MPVYLRTQAAVIMSDDPSYTSGLEHNATYTDETADQFVISERMRLETTPRVVAVGDIYGRLSLVMVQNEDDTETVTMVINPGSGSATVEVPPGRFAILPGPNVNVDLSFAATEDGIYARVTIVGIALVVEDPI